MSSKSTKTRQEQLKHFESAVAQRIEYLKSTITDNKFLEKDPVLRHLKGKATQIRKSLNAISNIKERKGPRVKNRKKGEKETENDD